MSQKKETFEDLLKSIANAHQVRKDYKNISKEFRLHPSTVMTADHVQMGAIQNHCYPSHDKQTNKDHNKSNMYNTPGAHKESQSNF